MIPVQADRRLKKSKPSYQRTNSQTFKMFDEAQIKEFKEIFGFLDQDGNGVIEVDDLVALHGIMGKPADEAALSAMIAEAPGPLDFQMLLQLFGEKMSGTDPEETIMAGWHLFDPTASARWESTLSRTSSAPAVSRPTVSPRLRSPRCSTRSNPLVANSTTANSPAS